MTPSEKKKRTRARVLRVAVPVLLAGLFASLALMEKSGVFTSVNRAGAGTEALPAAVPVPFTRLSVLNRLENEGFWADGDALTRDGADAGTLTLTETDGAVTKAVYSLILIPGSALPEDSAGESMQGQNESDARAAHLVFRAMLEAVLGGEEPPDTAFTQGEKKLDSCLNASASKSAAYTYGTADFTFEKTFSDGLYRLTVTAMRTG